MHTPSCSCVVSASGPFSGTAFLLPITSATAAVASFPKSLSETLQWAVAGAPVVFVRPSLKNPELFLFYQSASFDWDKQTTFWAPRKDSRASWALEVSAGLVCDHSWRSMWFNPPWPLLGGQEKKGDLKCLQHSLWRPGCGGGCSKILTNVRCPLKNQCSLFILVLGKLSGEKTGKY